MSIAIILAMLYLARLWHYLKQNHTVITKRSQYAVFTAMVLYFFLR